MSAIKRLKLPACQLNPVSINHFDTRYKKLRTAAITKQYRGSFTHRTPINQPDTRSSIVVEKDKATYGSADENFIASSVIKENLTTSINSIAKMLNALKALLPQKV